MTGHELISMKIPQSGSKHTRDGTLIN